jgi:hypothetical protein
MNGGECIPILYRYFHATAGCVGCLYGRQGVLNQLGSARGLASLLLEY